MKTASVRLAAAKTLALSNHEFVGNYAHLAAHVSEYTSSFKSRIKAVNRELSVRLVLRCIEEKPRFHALRNHLRDPAKENPTNHQADMLDALKESYQRLSASGLYTAKGALGYARNGVGVFRWLGEVKGYPRLPPQVSLNGSNVDRSYRDSGLEPPFKPMVDAEIASMLGETFMADLKKYTGEKGYQVKNRTRGFRYLMTFMTENPSDQSDALIASLSGDASIVCDPASVMALIEECERALRNSKAFAKETVDDLIRNCGYLFEFLGKLPGRTYPRFSRRFKKFGFVPPESKTVTDLDIPGTTDLSGAAKLRRSLQLISDAAMEVVLSNVRYFDLMAPARDGALLVGRPKKQVKAFDAVGKVLRAEVRSLQETGHSQFTKLGLRTNGRAVDRAMATLSEPETWRNAGASEFLPDTETLTFSQIMKLVCAAMAATSEAVLAAKIIFAVETGWNPQPIADIPSEVFVFRLKNEVGIASASFLSVFKKRAGHDVQAFLEHPSKLSGGRETNALALWDEAEREKRWKSHDERHLLSYTSPAYEAIELMRPMVQAVDQLTRDEEIKARFFKHLAWNSVATKQVPIQRHFKQGVLSTQGLTFKIIRKSFLQLKFRVESSVEALRFDADHAGSGVLFPHYLNSNEVKRELEQSTRFFQNSIQSLVIAQVGKPLEKLISVGDHEWFYNLAKISGVASACGFGVSSPIDTRPAIQFDPSDENVRSLIALSLSLDAEEKAANPRRWLMVGVPLRGFVLAIRMKLQKAGATRLLERIEKELTQDLRSGRAVLPPLNLAGGY